MCYRVLNVVVLFLRYMSPVVFSKSTQMRHLAGGDQPAVLDDGHLVAESFSDLQHVSGAQGLCDFKGVRVKLNFLLAHIGGQRVGPDINAGDGGNYRSVPGGARV